MKLIMGRVSRHSPEPYISPCLEVFQAPTERLWEYKVIRIWKFGGWVWRLLNRYTGPPPSCLAKKFTGSCRRCEGRLSRPIEYRRRTAKTTSQGICPISLPSDGFSFRIKNTAHFSPGHPRTNDREAVLGQSGCFRQKTSKTYPVSVHQSPITNRQPPTTNHQSLKCPRTWTSAS